MPVPAVYSEAGFAAYLTSVLGELAEALDWDASDPRVLEAVTDALLKYGTTDITTVTAPADLDGLRALGRRAIWRAVVQATAGNYQVGSPEWSLHREQVHKQAADMLKIAEADCAEALGIGLSFGRLTLDFLEPASEWK